MRRLYSAALTLIMITLAAPATVLATEGLAGATVGETGGGNGSDRRARFEEWCRSEPAKCEELRVRRAERRKQCEADPAQCRAERRARFEHWCKDNEEKCKEIQARREQCQANPERCRAEREARFNERFKQADADGNGALSRAEAEKGMPRLARHFDALDANKDGVVSREELEAARKARAARRHKSRES
jgi:hypothetical protein